jgi:hypothetical protein
MFSPGSLPTSFAGSSHDAHLVVAVIRDRTSKCISRSANQAWRGYPNAATFGFGGVPPLAE